MRPNKSRLLFCHDDWIGCNCHVGNKLNIDYKKGFIRMLFSKGKVSQTSTIDDYYIGLCSLFLVSMTRAAKISWFCALFFLIQPSQSYNPFEHFGVYCKPEAYRQLVRKEGCDSGYIRVKACLGTCASQAYPLDHPPYFKKMCSCCKPSSTRWQVFSLQNCGSGISPFIHVESAVNCKCIECN